MTPDPYAAAAASARRLADLTGEERHDVAIILGSGWAAAADALGVPDATVALADVGAPAPSVRGHQPFVRSVRVAGWRALVFLGRVHLYEGYSPATIVHNVRMAVEAGCSSVILTNAAGGIVEGMRPGQAVLIGDHINLTGASPLAGPRPPAGYPSRFTDLTDLYSPRLRTVARTAAPTLSQAVYAGLPGPHYETPAEVRMLATLGAGLVGMSTVLEAIAARHLGAEVLGVSLVTNIAAGLSEQPVEHTDVLATGARAAAGLGTLLAAILAEAAT